MITVTKEFKWEMSHRLEGHKGLCKNIHGHNYKMIVEVARSTKSEELIESSLSSSNGMVIDFKDLKKIINDNIIDYFDHSFCYNEKNEDNVLIGVFLKDTINQKLAPLPYRATAENIAKWIYKKLVEVFSHMQLMIVSVKIYENDESIAVYNLR